MLPPQPDCVYQIISGKVSATPISIPAPNNVPVSLQQTAERDYEFLKNRI